MEMGREAKWEAFHGKDRHREQNSGKTNTQQTQQTHYKHTTNTIQTHYKHNTNIQSCRYCTYMDGTAANKCLSSYWTEHLVSLTPYAMSATYFIFTFKTSCMFVMS